MVVLRSKNEVEGMKRAGEHTLVEQRGRRKRRTSWSGEPYDHPTEMVGMTKAIPLSDRHAGHILGRIERKAA
jgi:hypothetical protein